MCCDKSALRREMLKRRVSEAKEENGELIAGKIRALPQFEKARSVMLYMPIKGEADVTSLLSEEKSFLFPVTEGDRMYAAGFDGEFEKGAFGVPEPKGRKEYAGEIDIVIVPGVAFGRDFNRIGFGKGYYDRFLAGRKCLKIGVCHAFQLTDTIDAAPHDIKTDLIITEDEVLWNRESTSSDL